MVGPLRGEGGLRPDQEEEKNFEAKKKGWPLARLGGGVGP